MLAGLRAIVCLGAGGVGKTSVAAALSVSAARQGRRVLALTVDPAGRLADSLGVDRSRPGVQELSAERLSQLQIAAPGALGVAVLDAQRTLYELVERLVTDPARRASLTQHPLFEHLGAYLAGAGEYMAIEQLLQSLDEPDRDLIVLDTPPSRHALDVLDAPERFRRAVDNPMLGVLMRAVDEASKRSFDWVGRGLSLSLRSLSRLTGAGTLEQVATLLWELRVLAGGFGERAELVAQAFRRPDFGYVLVTRPTRPAIAATLELAQTLEERALRRHLVALNCSHETASAEVISRGLSELERVAAAPLFVPLKRAVQEHAALSAHEREQERALWGATTLSQTACVRLPALNLGVARLAELGRLAEHFEVCW